jgi:hypothetical protein
MLWVAIDRGIRLAEKRSLPAPNREKWYAKVRILLHFIFLSFSQT